MPPTTAIATRSKPRPLPNAEEVLALARLLYQGGLVSKHANSPEKLAVRIIAGQEVGLAAIQAINNIMVVNGRAVIWGDSALALVRASGKLLEFEEFFEGEGHYRVAVCRSVRQVAKGKPEERITRFSIDDAKRANLWGKDGPWTDYPDRMQQMRARSWNLRDGFGDILSGLGIYEEEIDVLTPAPKVEVKNVVSDPAPAKSAAVTAVETPLAHEVVDAVLLDQLAELRPEWLRAVGVDPENADAVRAIWSATIRQHAPDATSAKQMTPKQGEALFNAMKHAVYEQQAKDAFGDTKPGN